VIFYIMVDFKYMTWWSLETRNPNSQAAPPCWKVFQQQANGAELTVGVAMVCSFLRERVQPLKWTWWGLAGGGLWVMTGILAITAVRLAGIGTAQSLWSGLSSMFSNLHNLFLLATKLHLFAWVYLLLLHSWNKLDVWDMPTLGT
jgi:hypothetical protein